MSYKPSLSTSFRTKLKYKTLILDCRSITPSQSLRIASLHWDCTFIQMWVGCGCRHIAHPYTEAHCFPDILLATYEFRAI